MYLDDLNHSSLTSKSKLCDYLNISVTQEIQDEQIKELLAKGLGKLVDGCIEEKSGNSQVEGNPPFRQVGKNCGRTS